MPELPEVETMVRGIRTTVEGRAIQEIEFHCIRCRPMSIKPAPKAWVKKTVGKTVDSVSRLGKRVLFTLSDASNLVIEPRMTGLVLLADAPDVEHLRFTIKFAPDSRYQHHSVSFWDRRGLGVLQWLAPQNFAKEFPPGRLGPDALKMTAKKWKIALARTSRSVKVVMLDQSVVAGIGNLYASEILFVARILPDRPACELSDADINRIAIATQKVLKKAISLEGSTLGDATYRNALNQTGRYQNLHRVYNKEGLLCPDCGTTNVVRTVLAQRATFFCPKCQQ